VSGTDRNFDTNVNDRPAGVAGNSGKGFAYACLDLRISRRFRFGDRADLEMMVEGFNILKRANFQLPNNTFNSGATPVPGFGAPTAAADPRQIQLGLRLNF
jgi:hypothetical protein